MTKSYARETARPRRRVSIFWLLGIAVLVTSVAGTSWMFRSHAGDGSSKGNTENAAAPARGEQAVICLGYADAEQGITNLVPSRPYRVVEVKAREGETAKAGTVLLRLDDFVSRRELEAAEAKLKEAEVKLTEAKKTREKHQSQIARQKLAIQAAQKKVEMAREGFTRKQQLVNVKQLSVEELNVAAKEVELADLGVEAEQETLRGLEMLDPSALEDLAEAQRKAAQSLLEQAQYAVAECELKAPTDGTILRAYATQGELYGPHSKQPAFIFAPHGPRIIRMEVEQEFASRVKIGQPATVHDEFASGMSWRGQVVRMADWYTHRRSQTQEPILLSSDSRTLECIVQLDTDQPPLRIGQRVRVTLGQVPR